MSDKLPVTCGCCHKPFLLGEGERWERKRRQLEHDLQRAACYTQGYRGWLCPECAPFNHVSYRVVDNILPPPGVFAARSYCDITVT